MGALNKKLIEQGIKVADYNIYQEDKIWSRYSNDKVDIGEELAKVIRTLNKAFPLSKAMRALSIGSSAEPQFRILETAFRGGLYLLDMDKEALEIVKERIERQYTDHVKPVRSDYKNVLLNQKKAKLFLRKKLDNKKVELITLHHSLYYCREAVWHELLANLYRYILAPKGAMHIVLMAAESSSQYTTTWLYNHFVGKFFGHHNNQNLCKFRQEMKRAALYKKAQILSRTNRVYFFVDDFEKFMAVVWMILLYPNVHRYSRKQKEEITEFVYKRFWKNKKPLIQEQDHLAIYRGIGFRGMI